MSSIDWAQSSLTNFSPLITREFEQDSNATIMAVADASLSTRCGVARRADRRGHRPRGRRRGAVGGVLPGSVRARHIRRAVRQLASARPRIGRSHVLYCLDLYRQSLSQSRDPERVQDIVAAIESQLRKASLVPVISDFLFADANALIQQLSHAQRGARHLSADGRRALRLRAAVRCRTGGWRCSTSRAAGRVCCRGGKCAGWPLGSANGRTRSSGWRAMRIWTSCASAWTVGDGNGVRQIHGRAAAAEDVMRIKGSALILASAFYSGSLPRSRADAHGTGTAVAPRAGRGPAGHAAAAASPVAARPALRRSRRARPSLAKSSRIRSAAGGRPIARRCASARGSGWC